MRLIVGTSLVLGAGSAEYRRVIVVEVEEGAGDEVGLCAGCIHGRYGVFLTQCHLRSLGDVGCFGPNSLPAKLYTWY